MVLMLRRSRFVCSGQTDRQRLDDDDDDALVTPHLDHPFVHGALQAHISALLPSCHPRHWSTEQTHVGAYPTDPTPLSSGRPTSPASGRTTRQRRPAAAALSGGLPPDGVSKTRCF